MNEQKGISKGKIILLVDDDVDFLDITESRLIKDGFKVARCEGQAAAEEFLNGGGQFDLAVVDLMMEFFDSGFVVCRKIKKADPKKPVIMATGVEGETGLAFSASTNEERSWIQADVMLEKPLRYDQLKKQIDILLPAD